MTWTVQTQHKQSSAKIDQLHPLPGDTRLMLALNEDTNVYLAVENRESINSTHSVTGQNFGRTFEIALL